MTAVQSVLDQLEGVKRDGDKWRALCPAHEDRTPSLSVAEGREGRALIHCHAGCDASAVLAAIRLKERDLFANRNGNGRRRSEIVATYDYVDQAGELLFQVVRFFPKDFCQRRPDGNGGWIWKLGDTRRVLYRLPELIEAVALEKVIFVVEGEKDVHAIEGVGGVATCNPMGAGKWRSEYSEPLRGACVRVVADRDDAGRDHARQVAEALQGVAASVEIVQAREGKDAADHIGAGLAISDFTALGRSEGETQGDLTIADFIAYLPMHRYIFVPACDLWPASSVNARVPPVVEGGRDVAASTWLDANQRVEQMTWAPGEPTVIRDRLISHGGWFEREGVSVFNLYRPPLIEPGDPAMAIRWVQHVERVFPNEAGHLIAWLAHRVQRPDEKVNHAIVLQGPQGTGKDTIIEGALPAIGPWNAQEVSPDQLLGRFNGFVKSVILRVSEARDLGDRDRYRLYDHLKTYTAAPPFVLRVDEKNIREYSVPNVCGVVITTNYTDGIYLPADDRRHFVAATELNKADFTESYWNALYQWYESGGYRHIAAYLRQLDITAFNPKAPPPKTAGFWAAVDAGRAPEDAELADALDKLGRPDAVTLSEIAKRAEGGFADWIGDRKNARQIPHRMEAAGYVSVRNDAAKDGRFKVGGRRRVVYARRELSVRDRLEAVSGLVQGQRQ